MSDLEQERRVARGRAVREARLDGGDDAARHAVAVPVGLAAPGAPRARRRPPRAARGAGSARRPSPRRAGPTSAPRRAPRRRPRRRRRRRRRAPPGAGAASAASALLREPPRHRARATTRAARARARDVDAAQQPVFGHGELALERLGPRPRTSLRPLADAAELAEEECARRALLAVRLGRRASARGRCLRGEGSASSAAESAESESPMRAASRAASSSATFVVICLAVAALSLMAISICARRVSRCSACGH